MGRKKIQITRIMDERNRQVSNKIIFFVFKSHGIKQTGAIELTHQWTPIDITFVIYQFTVNSSLGNFKISSLYI